MESTLADLWVLGCNLLLKSLFLFIKKIEAGQKVSKIEESTIKF